MKTFSIVGAALLGLVFSGTAMAQVPTTGAGAPATVGTPGTGLTPINGSGTVIPGQPNVPAGATTTGTISTGVGVPIGTSPVIVGSPGVQSGTTTVGGTVGSSTLDDGTLRTTQPAGSLPTTPGTRTTRRTTTNSRSTQTRP